MVFLIAAGLIGAAAGGALGYLTGGVGAVALGTGIGALAGVGAYGLGYALAGPRYGYPYPYPGGALPAYGYWPSLVYFQVPRFYYTSAY